MWGKEWDKMALSLNKLSARFVTTTMKPGRHSDGGGLYLVVDEGGARRWVFKYRRQDRVREMGLGGLKAVPLVKARELAADARAQLAAGIDPIAAKASGKITMPLFGDFADDLIVSATKSPRLP